MLFIDFTTNVLIQKSYVRKLIPIDLWTSHATEAYLTITVHFIDDQWNLISRVLHTCEMPKRHTGVNIASMLENAASEWNVPDECIVVVVCDNASNMRVAAEDCFAYTLQLAINTGVASDPLTRFTAAASKLVGHFKHNVIAISALRQKQKQTNVAEHHLIQDVTTR